MWAPTQLEINLMFKLVKEIRSKIGVLYFKRWELLKLPFGYIYLHQILRADEDGHLHDHPYDFVSLIIKGGYIEQVDSGKVFFRNRKLLSAVYMPATGIYHKIYKLHAPTWSLVFASNRKHHWGYKYKDGWVSNEEYRRLKHLNLL
jgi:hypothetical protein